MDSARARILIQRHMRLFEMLRHLSRFTDYLLMPLTADHVTRYNALQVAYAEQYVFCGENDFLWLIEWWQMMTVTGQARGLCFRTNSGLRCAGKYRRQTRLAVTAQMSFAVKPPRESGSDHRGHRRKMRVKIC